MGERTRRKSFAQTLKFWQQRNQGRADDILTGAIPWSGPPSTSSSKESFFEALQRNSRGSNGSEDVACQTSYSRLVDRIVNPPTDSRSKLSQDDSSDYPTDEEFMDTVDGNLRPNFSADDSLNASDNGRRIEETARPNLEAACDSACEPQEPQPSPSNARYVWWKRLATRVKGPSSSASSKYRIKSDKDKSVLSKWKRRLSIGGSKKSELEDRSKNWPPIAENIPEAEKSASNWSQLSGNGQGRNALPKFGRSSLDQIHSGQSSGRSKVYSDTGVENFRSKQRTNIPDCPDCYKAASCTFHVPYQPSKHDLEESPETVIRNLEDAARQLSREEYKNWPNYEDVYNPIDEVPQDPNPPKWRRVCLDFLLIFLSIIIFAWWFGERYAAYQISQQDAAVPVYASYTSTMDPEPCHSCDKSFNPLRTIRHHFRTFTDAFTTSRKDSTTV